MLTLGIEDREGLVYEGAWPYGHAAWPTPIITPAKIVFESEGSLVAERSGGATSQGWRFREDYFDPVSRIRRGRFYRATDRQPDEWHVQPHPALPFEGRANDVRDLVKHLHTFQARSIWNEYFKADRVEQPLVLLGLDYRFTVWTIVNIEVISTHEELVTLKARSSLGVLPEIRRDQIPAAFLARVDESLNAFADDVYRSAPVSVIDRARDAASQILLAYFEAERNEAKDLADLAKRIESKDKAIAASAAKIIHRLHARAKPSERARREMPVIREQDAQLATQCLGTLLRDLGWADWK